ncbi:MAG: HepT-like ribonuclease domain-containing protein [Ginsengibacter sp.]
MSEREIINLLEDIYDAAMKIINYTKNMSFDDFMQDDKTIDAVVRNFEIIGEASNRVPDDFKTEHPEVEWRRIIGFRNRIIHEYFGIDYENVWRIKNENVSLLSEFIKQILEDLNN